MSKFAIGEKGIMQPTTMRAARSAVFPTVDGSFRYAVDMEGYGALQFFAEEKLEEEGARCLQGLKSDLTYRNNRT